MAAFHLFFVLARGRRFLWADAKREGLPNADGMLYGRWRSIWVGCRCYSNRPVD